MVFFLTIRLKNYKKAFEVIFILISIICIGTVAVFPNLNFNILRHLNLIAIFYFCSFVYLSSISQKKMKIILLFLFVLIFLIRFYSINKFDFYGLSLFVICIIVFLLGRNKTIRIPITTDISYGMYIFAFSIQQMVVMFIVNNNPWLVIFYSLLITVPIGYLSWHLIEKRFINYKLNKKINFTTGTFNLNNGEKDYPSTHRH